MIVRFFLCVSILLLLPLTGISALDDTAPSFYSSESSEAEVTSAEVLDTYSNLPLLFIENQGQLDERVRYYIKKSGQTIYLTDEGIVFDVFRYKNASETEQMDFMPL